ncbi:MAG: hypothetical protein ACHQNT_06075 [Bacteroidia bacterium]
MNEKERIFENAIGAFVNKPEARKKKQDEAIDYFSELQKNQKQFSDVETVCNLASIIRWRAIENLDKYLIEFEANFIKRGGKIIWAQDTNEAATEIKKLVKNPAAVYLPVNPGNLVKECSISDIFSSAQKTGRYNSAIAEADFLAANPGAVCIMNPEKEFMACESKIILAGIDKMLPLVSDFDLFLHLQSVYQFQTPLTCLNQIITGPAINEGGNYTEDIYVILVDNGRSKVLNDEIARQGLLCIGSGACRYTDSVYRMTDGENGGYSNQLLTTMLAYRSDFNSNFHLSDSQLLDGFSSSICPVKIDFTKIILHTRKLAVEKQLKSKSDKWFYFFWKKAMLKRSPVLLKGINTYGFFVNSIFNRSEKGLRNTYEPAKKSFNEQWREKMKL